MKSIVNGAPLAYDDVGSGPAIILIHGFPLSRRMWRPQVEALASAGYRVVAPDLRGFGESEALEGPWTISGASDDLIALMDGLGIGRAVVCGMSMGGYLLLDLLDRHPGRLAAAVFAVTRAGGDDEEGRRRRTEMAIEAEGGNPGVVKETFGGILFGAQTPEEKPELVREVAGMMAAAGPKTHAEALRAIRDRKDYTDLLARFDLPALVIGAEEDRAIPAEESLFLAERLPQALCRILSGGGHMVNLEAPEAFNGALLEFFGGLEGGTNMGF